MTTIPADDVRCQRDLYTVPGLRCSHKAVPGFRFCKRHSRGPGDHPTEQGRNVASTKGAGGKSQ